MSQTWKVRSLLTGRETADSTSSAARCLAGLLGLLLAAGAARAEVVYDFSADAGVNRFGYKETISSTPIPSSTTTVPNTPFDAADNLAVAASDDIRQTSGVEDSHQRAASRFVFQIQEPASSLTAITVSWEGLTQAGGMAMVYVWDNFTVSYAFVGSTSATSDTTVSATLTVNPSRYVNASHELVLLVLNTKQGRFVSTDDVHVSLRQCESGGECDDGNACTTDSCDDGACVHADNSHACPEDGNACTDDVCAGGACTHPAKSNGTACDDGNACTQTDTCQGETCTGTNPVTCATPDQCHDAGTCDPQTGLCSNPAKPDESACNDGNGCTQSDTCQAGSCTGSNPVTCTALDPCHEVGTCDPETGLCSSPAKPDGTACSDGNACTQTDACQAGVCTGTNPVSCTASDQCHDVGTCNPETGLCSNPAKADGTACSDGNVCTLDDVCIDGTCRSGPAPDCSSAGDQCNDASCDPSGAEPNCSIRMPKANGTICEDGLFCTVAETCTDGVCGGPVRDCTSVADQCNEAVCNEEADACQPRPMVDGQSCNDDLFCTVNDACQAGVCRGADRVCSDVFDQCHFGVCNEDSNFCEAHPVADGTACDDQHFCTVEDACRSGSCEGAPRDCSGIGDQCNTGVCNDTIGQCVAQPVSDGTACADGDACHAGESCQTGLCTGGQDVDCSSLNSSCTTVACNPAGTEGNCDTVTPVADDSPCEDGLFCTTGDACLTGLCVTGPAPCEAGALCDESADACVECLVASQCDDGVGCTDDTCDVGTCLHTANNEHCPGDGRYCSGTEYCDAALDCQSTGTPCAEGELCNEETDTCGECLVDADCHDGVDCTDDVCLDGGCRYDVNDQNCPDDGLFCNGREVCNNLLGCESTGNPCSQNVFCNEETDACDQCVTDADCDDGDPCTVGHACVAGACHAAHAVDCSGQSDQCIRASCDPLGETGNCGVRTPFDDGAACDDGAFCTVDDVCLAGVCTTGAARDCSGAGDQCNVGACDEEADACTTRPVEDGNVCDDEQFCTTDDACTAGVCGGAPRDCSLAGNACNEGVCNEETDACEAHPLADGTPCDDQLFCTVEDACREGVCGGALRNCDAVTDQCNAGHCNEQLDACLPKPIEDGSPCDDGNVCLVGEACREGLCQGGSPPDCSLVDQCNHGACYPLGAEGNCDLLIPVDDGMPCNDGQFCTDQDVCKSGACVGVRPHDCSMLSDPCNVGVCDEGAQDCRLQPVDDGMSCFDGLFCTDGEVCHAGECGGGTPHDCSDFADPCNVGLCNEDADSCETRPVEDGASCDDGHFCTDGESCQAGECSGGELHDCSAVSDQCNSGVCNEDTDACEPQPVENGTTCDDELYCTDGEFCRSGLCGGGTPHDCSESADPCNAGVCNEEADACEAHPVEDGTACNDEHPCTKNDACHKGVCTGSVAYGLIDWNLLAACVAGTDQEAGEDCTCYDFNDDGRVDMLDVDIFTRSFDGQ